MCRNVVRFVRPYVKQKQCHGGATVNIAVPSLLLCHFAK